MRSLILSCVLVSCFAARPNGLRAQSATASVAELGPGDIALQLQRSRKGTGVDYRAQLQAAENAFAEGAFAKTDQLLMDLAEKTFLDSRAIELAYRARRAMGQDSAARQTLLEGLETYPHALRLLRIAPLQALQDDRLTLAAIEGDRRFPAALRYELRAGYAFRQNDFATGLLEAERASYLYGDDGALSPEVMQAVAEVYARLLSADAPPPSRSRSADDGFAERYTQAFYLAAEKLRESGMKDLSRLGAVAKLRTVALRLFVRDGGLAAYPEPMLIDLYVLDRAGHLETATALQLGWMFPRERLAFEQAHPGEVARMRAYIAEDWRTAADAYAK